MPIKISDQLPAYESLIKENVFLMSKERADAQDIRPLKIAILNLMPQKTKTEIQLLRLLGNTPLQIEIDLIHTSTYHSKTTDSEHLLQFYKDFYVIKHEKFDGLIITGAPVEQMRFEEVAYWKELCEIMEWSKTNVFSTFHICFGAYAGLYYHHRIQKHNLNQKTFGVFNHRLCTKDNPLIYGFDDEFFAPHSCNTSISEQDIIDCEELELLSVSDEVGAYLIASKDGRQIFVMGHSEYDKNNLSDEYYRDKNNGVAIQIPKNYFPMDDPLNTPSINWKAHGNLLFSNWLNYFVYQKTPFDNEKIQ